MCEDNQVDSATRTQYAESLVTHGLTDKATYLSKATKLCLTFSPCLLFLHVIDHTQMYNICITSCYDAIHLKIGFKPLMEVD